MDERSKNPQKILDHLKNKNAEEVELIKVQKIFDFLDASRSKHPNRYPDESKIEDPARSLYISAIRCLDELEECTLLTYDVEHLGKWQEENTKECLEIFVKYADDLIKEMTFRKESFENYLKNVDGKSR